MSYPVHTHTHTHTHTNETCVRLMRFVVCTSINDDWLPKEKALPKRTQRQRLVMMHLPHRFKSFPRPLIT